MRLADRDKYSEFPGIHSITNRAVMLWSMLALVGSFTFQDSRSNAKWLAAYLLLTLISGLIDGWDVLKKPCHLQIYDVQPLPSCAKADWHIQKCRSALSLTPTTFSNYPDAHG